MYHNNCQRSADAVQAVWRNCAWPRAAHLLLGFAGRVFWLLLLLLALLLLLLLAAGCRAQEPGRHAQLEG